MSPQPGQNLSHYRLIEKIGEGGMGVVWKAVDTTLDREVAIKLLPPAFSQDHVRVARFEREAKLLASLNHPNVASIYELHELDAVHFLVMELVDGESLANRLARGPVPVDEALAIGRQVAEALEATHARGVIHRDLKPSNIQLTAEGRVKVLDFGLAKTTEVETASGDPSMSPTVTSVGTIAGTILGTAGYMSPEQARGQRVDTRTDVWAFGCVVYEMLTGRPAFEGETITDTLARLLERDPDWGLLPRSVRGEVRRLLRRCLEKDVARRLQAIGEARIVIEDLQSGRVAPAEESPAARRPWLRVLPWAVIPLAAAAAWLLRPGADPAGASTIRYTVAMPQGERLTADFRPGFALSPDGGLLAFVSGAPNEGAPRRSPFAEPVRRQLWSRRLDGWEARPIEGTDDALWPVFSPDGEWLAFITPDPDPSIKKVPVGGGEVVRLCECQADFGLSWGSGGSIVFATMEGVLQRVPASGGEPEPVTRLDTDAGEMSHRLPHFLPDGENVLFTVAPLTGAGSDWTGRIYVQSLRTGQRTPLVEDGSDARYVPTGHLVFAREGRLMAVPFDAGQIEITGPEAPVLQEVSHALHTGFSLTETGAAYYAFSSSGTLAYVAGSVFPELRSEVVWVDRHGTEEPLGVEAAAYSSVRVSPDGREVLLTRGYLPRNVLVFDRERETLRRQTFDGMQTFAIWGPGAEWVTFTSGQEQVEGLYRKALDSGPGGMEMLSGAGVAGAWSADGSRLVFAGRDDETGLDIWTLPADGEPEPLLQTRFHEAYPEFSPDGRWLLYTSDESGRPEAYVRPYPGPGPAVQVSTRGALECAWSRDGREILYVWQGKANAVPVKSDGERLEAGAPVELFEWSYLSAVPARAWDVAPDGRLLVTRQAPEAAKEKVRDIFSPHHVRVVVNWFDELRDQTRSAR